MCAIEACIQDLLVSLSLESCGEVTISLGLAWIEAQGVARTLAVREDTVAPAAFEKPYQADIHRAQSPTHFRFRLLTRTRTVPSRSEYPF
jgi:hypothetical protein